MTKDSMLKNRVDYTCSKLARTVIPESNKSLLEYLENELSEEELKELVVQDGIFDAFKSNKVIKAKREQFEELNDILEEVRNNGEV